MVIEGDDRVRTQLANFERFFRTSRDFTGTLSALHCSNIVRLAKAEIRPALPDEGTRERLISIFIPCISGAPFTATVNTECVRALPDGTRITLVNHRLIARDSAGRIFQERRMLVPQYRKQQSRVTQTEISDPAFKQRSGE